MTKNVIDVFDEIRQERQRQDAQWGGPEHDDTHETHEWMTFIRKQVERWERMYLTHLAHAHPHQVAREVWIKIAALAVAAVESMDRKSSDTRLDSDMPTL